MRVHFKTKEELKSIVDEIPVNTPVHVIVGRFGFTRRLPLGQLQKPVWHGEWAVSFLWLSSDKKYMEYVWITTSHDMDSIVEVIKED